MRKHQKQMTPAERQHVENHIHGLRGWILKPHAIKRGLERVVDTDALYTTMRIGDVIEVHNDVPAQIRAVLRADLGNASICVAADLTNREIVSVWVNALDDQHDTLNLGNYRWQVDLTRHPLR